MPLAFPRFDPGLLIYFLHEVVDGDSFQDVVVHGLILGRRQDLEPSRLASAPDGHQIPPYRVHYTGGYLNVGVLLSVVSNCKPKHNQQKRKLN